MAQLRPGDRAGESLGDDATAPESLDLVLILEACDLPIWERLRRWDMGSLRMECDLLVYSQEEWRSLPAWNPRLAEALGQDTRWLVGVPGMGVGRDPAGAVDRLVGIALA